MNKAMKNRVGSFGKMMLAATAAGLAFAAAAGNAHYQRARKSPEWFTRGRPLPF